MIKTANSKYYSGQLDPTEQTAGRQALGYDLYKSLAAYLRLIGGSSTYGDTPSLTYGIYDASSGGTLISDASPSGTATWSQSLTNTSAAITYSLGYGSGISIDPNSDYALSAGDAVNWIINKANATVTANSDTVTYNGQAQSVSGFKVSGLVNNETASVLTSTTASGATGTNAGSYTNTASGNATDGNYILSFVNGNLTIDKAAATVTANSDSVTYNGLAQSVSGFTASGLVNGETVAVLTGVSEAGGSGTNAGSYSHTLSGSDGNYTLSFVDGVLMITTVSPVVIPPPFTSPLPAPLASALSLGDTLDTSGVTTGGTGETSSGGGFISPNPLLNVNPNAIISLVSVNTTSAVKGDASASGITISLGQASGGGAAEGAQLGVVTVSVPKAMVADGSNLSFELPTQLRETLGAGEMSASLADGSVLPAWITFNPATLKFEANAVPAGGLPLQVMIRVGSKEVMVVISEREE